RPQPDLWSRWSRREVGLVKITIVGGGSTYTPELIDGIARLGDEAELDAVVLHDPATERLDAVAGVSRRILDRYGWPGQLSATGGPGGALRGAGVVLFQLGVGGQAGPHLGAKVPL